MKTRCMIKMRNVPALKVERWQSLTGGTKKDEKMGFPRMIWDFGGNWGGAEDCGLRALFVGVLRHKSLLMTLVGRI